MMACPPSQSKGLEASQSFQVAIVDLGREHRESEDVDSDISFRSVFDIPVASEVIVDT